MADQAARDGDPTLCRHHAYGLKTVATRGVNVNGRPAAKALDASGCTGKLVVTGSGTVTINSRLAARAGDLTTDGAIFGGSVNVVIGGPRTGVTAGSFEAQKVACLNDSCQSPMSTGLRPFSHEGTSHSVHCINLRLNAAKTRTSGGTDQSYGNCGLESWRNVINKQRAAQGLPAVTEDELLHKAVAMGLAGDDPVNKPWAYGATSADGRTEILQAYGIELETAPQSVESIRQAVESGRAVSMSLTPYHWGAYVNSDWLHEVAVTGIEYNASGEVAAFIVNDTGLGTCAARIPIADVNKGMADLPMTVSKQPVW
jgi:uncharacterized Zn-binding protein involved in type VI secretion